MIGQFSEFPWWWVVVAGSVLWLMNSVGGRVGHGRRIAAARRVLDKLAQIDEPGAKLSYLRQVNPFTFEELILTALHARGYKIKRNRRYTGDGGLDGKFWFNGHQFYVQAKRYSHHIKAQHVREFNKLCEEKGVYGLFVHTGRTGELANSAHYDSIMMLSGDRLLSLLTVDRPVRLDLTNQFYVVL